MITEADKDKIIDLIVLSVTEHPEWFGDIVQAMQYGLSQALSNERQHSSDLAMGLITFVQWEQSKNKHFPYYFNISSSLSALRDWFDGTPAWEQVKQILNVIKEN